MTSIRSRIPLHMATRRSIRLKRKFDAYEEGQDAAELVQMEQALHRHENASDSPERLCHQCKEIDMERLFSWRTLKSLNNRTPVRSSLTMYLENKLDMAKCALCRLFDSVAPLTDTASSKKGVISYMSAERIDMMFLGRECPRGFLALPSVLRAPGRVLVGLGPATLNIPANKLGIRARG